MRFSGFDKGTLFTPVPNPLFGPLLEQIHDLAELKVTLRGMWMMHRVRGRPQVVKLSNFLSDESLLRGLGGLGRDPKEEVRRGLELAVARGTFLLHRLENGSAAEAVYLLNTGSGRDAVSHMRSESGSIRDDDPWQVEESQVEDSKEDPPGEKPNIFALYENNVGTLSPLLAEQLKEAEDAYPWRWINEAFQIAVAENKRNWRYIAGILRRWAAEGKDDGKPGRHPEKDNRRKYLEDYERRWSRSPRDIPGDRLGDRDRR